MINFDADDGYYDASELINKKGYATLGEIAQDICNKKGLELASSSFLNSDKRVAVYDNSVKAREYMSFIGESAGGFVCAGRDGKIYIRDFGQDEIEIPLKLFKTYKFGEEYQISRVAYEDGTRSFKFGDETRNTLWINQENMFIVDEEQVQKIYSKLKKLTINSFEGTVIIDPRVDIGDKIIINGKPILWQGEMSLSRRFIADIKSKISIKQKQETTVRRESQTVINRRVKSEINQIDGTIKQLVGEDTESGFVMAEHIVSLSGISGRVEKLEEKSISNVDVEYALSTSTTAAPTTGWSTSAPTWEQGKYMWQRTVTTYADNTTETSNPTCISGAKGDTGNPGQNGTNGQNGDDGIGVSEIVEEYYLSTSNSIQTGGSWQTTQPTWTKGKYIWTRSKVTWTDNSTTYTTPVLASSINKANETANNANETANDTKTNFGTYVEQNHEHVKVAWNQISEFIQMMIINQKASFAILDSNKKVLAYFDKTGEHFCDSNGNVFGEMGVQNVDNNNYIAFSVESDYDTDTQDGMAWGIKTKKDNKFHPILFIRNFNIGPENSDGSFGELELNSCDLVLNGLGTGIKTGGVLIYGDPAGLALSFLAQETRTNLLTICPPSFLGEASMEILDKIFFFKNQAGSNTFKIGDNNNNCLLTDDGHIVADTIDSRGYVGGLGFVNISIEENKKNFEKLENALDILKEIDIYKYNYKIENNETKKHIGVVIGDDFNYSKKITDNNNKGIDIYNFTSLCCKAIQEQQEMIEELQEKGKQKDEIIANLITRIEALEKGASK